MWSNLQFPINLVTLSGNFIFVQCPMQELLFIRTNKHKVLTALTPLSSVHYFTISLFIEWSIIKIREDFLHRTGKKCTYFVREKKRKYTEHLHGCLRFSVWMDLVGNEMKYFRADLLTSSRNFTRSEA